jgi:hypothetical protein
MNLETDIRIIVLYWIKTFQRPLSIFKYIHLWHYLIWTKMHLILLFYSFLSLIYILLYSIVMYFQSSIKIRILYICVYHIKKPKWYSSMIQNILGMTTKRIGYLFLIVNFRFQLNLIRNTWFNSPNKVSVTL